MTGIEVFTDLLFAFKVADKRNKSKNKSDDKKTVSKPFKWNERFFK